jgi:hypothetical protein
MIEAMKRFARKLRQPAKMVAALLLGTGVQVLALPPESPTQGPFKSPFDWPTYWFVEEEQAPTESSYSPTGEEGLEALRPTAVKEETPRITRFKGKLGSLYNLENDRSLPVVATPAAIAPHSAPGLHFRYWLKGEILTHAPYLSPLNDGKARDGECRITYHASNESEILQPYDKLTLNKGSEDGLNIGDIYELYEVGPSGYAFGSSHVIGREIIPNGIAEVVAIKGKTATARLVQCFGTISRSTRASPMIKGEKRASILGYKTLTGDRPSAHVVWVPGAGQLPQPFNYVVLDKGLEGGFRLADHVMLLNKRKGKMSENVLGEGLVVHVEANSATILVHDVFPGIINPGDFALAVQSAQR